MKITVLGAGYVGLVTATCFAELGNEVLCVEKIESKVAKLSKGICPFYEPGLQDLLKKNIEKGRLKFSNQFKDAVAFSDVIFLCVATPQSETGHADLSQIEYASRNIAIEMKSYKLIIEKSTVPVNTHKWVKMTVDRYSAKGLNYDVASNPEFLREGSAIYDFMAPDRIVVGADSEKAKNIFKELYKPLTDKGFNLIITTPSAAELIKHASNSFLAVKISYINMVATLCEKVGADIEMVSNGIGADKRIGSQFLNAGIGYGGSCFPKDVKAFIKMGEDNGIDFSILKDAEKINTNARIRFMDKIDDILWISMDKNVAVWGLAFKPETDDIREAPAIDIVKKLTQSGAIIRMYDPEAMENFRNLIPESENIIYCKDKYDALKNADALIILTEWTEFIEADFDKIKNNMRLPIIIDGRNIYNVQQMKEKNFEYYSIGRM